MVHYDQKEFHNAITSCVGQVAPYTLCCWIHNQHISHCITDVTLKRGMLCNLLVSFFCVSFCMFQCDFSKCMFWLLTNTPKAKIMPYKSTVIYLPQVTPSSFEVTLYTFDSISTGGTKLVSLSFALVRSAFASIFGRFIDFLKKWSSMNFVFLNILF